MPAIFENAHHCRRAVLPDHTSAARTGDAHAQGQAHEGHPRVATRVTWMGPVAFRSLSRKGPGTLSGLMTNIHMVLLVFLR